MSQEIEVEKIPRLGANQTVVKTWGERIHSPNPYHRHLYAIVYNESYQILDELESLIYEYIQPLPSCFPTTAREKSLLSTPLIDNKRRTIVITPHTIAVILSSAQWQHIITYIADDYITVVWRSLKMLPQYARDKVHKATIFPAGSKWATIKSTRDIILLHRAHQLAHELIPLISLLFSIPYNKTVFSTFHGLYITKCNPLKPCPPPDDP